MKYILLTYLILGLSFITNAQNIEIEGKLIIDGKARILDMAKNNGVDSVVVRFPDGTLGVRDVATLVEYQLLTVSNDTIYLTNGGFVVLKDNSNTNEKITGFGIVGDSLYIKEGSTDTMKVKLVDKSIVGGFWKEDTLKLNLADGSIISIDPYVPPPIPPVQPRLDAGETPLEIYQSGTPLDSFYCKDYQGGLIIGLDTINGGGLVAAPSAIGVAQWGCEIPTNDPSGEINTIFILENCTTPDIAFDLCRDYNGGGYNDWFLPSINELPLLQLLFSRGCGNPISGNVEYWSSTSTTGASAETWKFYDGTQGHNRPKGAFNVVHPFRSF